MFTITPIKGDIASINGFFADGLSANISPTKPKNWSDVAFIYSDTMCEVEAIFTTNSFQAAALVHYQTYPKDFQTNFVLINSQNANAMTGQTGLDNIKQINKQLQTSYPNIKNPIFSSTGVIGVQLPVSNILKSLDDINLCAKNGDKAAKAILTTDKYSKTTLYEVKLNDGKTFKIGAIAKGAGMIDPNMATMLCFICTDAKVPKSHMKKLLYYANNTTFDTISVDGDTSTNDTVMLLANNKSGVYNQDAFKEVLKLVMQDIALSIISDGEGATKYVVFEVIGAKDDNQAKIIAKKLSNSLLVKTALFGGDPNWGRIASTIGASGCEVFENSLSISFVGVINNKQTTITVYDKGQIHFDNNIELQASNIFATTNFKISCDIGIGDGKYTAFGCDLGIEYVKINSQYRS